MLVPPPSIEWIAPLISSISSPQFTTVTLRLVPMSSAYFRSQYTIEDWAAIDQALLHLHEKLEHGLRVVVLGVGMPLVDFKVVAAEFLSGTSAKGIIEFAIG